jgi:hypothetical protein
LGIFGPMHPLWIEADGGAAGVAKPELINSLSRGG